MTTNTRPLTPIYTLDDFRPEGEYNEETLHLFMTALEPTEEDIARQLTVEQQKEICIRHKCRVDAYRWNPVYDYKICLLKKGTLDCRSTKGQLRHLAKAVNRHKKTIMYDEELIKKTREIEWRIRKKDSILSLDVWAYQRQKEQESQTVEVNVSATDGQLPELLENVDIHPVLTEELQLPVEVAPLPPALCAEMFCSQISESELSNISDDTGSTMIEAKYNSAELQAIGGNKDVVHMFDVNTESMTVCDSEASEARLLSQEQQSALQSQEIFHNEYEEFGVDIPLTSTQSQN